MFTYIDKNGNERNLRFVCPECGNNVLEEITRRTTTRQPILGLDLTEDGEVDGFYLGETEFEDEPDQEVTLNCIECGWTVADNEGNEIIGAEDLLKWLEKQIQ